MRRVCAWLCTKGYMPCWKGLYKRWFVGGPGNHALWVELAKMFNIPLVLQLNAISDLQTDCARSGDSYYPVRAFPLRRQLVCTLGGLNAPKDKVTFLKTPGMNHAAVIATQGLLVACCSHSRPKTIFLKERRVILPQLLLLKLILSEHSR